MSLASNALVSVAEYKSYIGLDPSDGNVRDERLELFVNIASQDIEKYCKRKFRSGSAVEIRDGNGTSVMYVDQSPIVTLSEIAYWYGSNTGFSALSSSDYDWETKDNAGKIYFTDGTEFTRGSMNWRLTYTYGYDRDDVPSDLKMACFQLVQRIELKAGNKGKDGKEGLQSENFGDSSTTYDLATMPADIAKRLDNYRRRRFG